MHLKPLYDIQQTLDERIRTQHGLHDADLLPKKLLALQVELGEHANETRCIKYWSTKPASERIVILEEYVDALHFVLSIGLDLGYADIDVRAEESGTDLTGCFAHLLACTVLLGR